MKRYPLESRESSKPVRILQLIFGIVCIFIAGWWTVFILRVPENANFWFAIIFMLLFGIFQIYSGLGYASKYLTVDSERLIIKKTVFGRTEVFAGTDIERILIFPLSVSVVLRNRRTISLRFPVTLGEGIDRVKDALAEYARDNKIMSEEKSDMT